VLAAPPAGEGFPAGSYTPFGYLDNPHHTWDLHQSGVLRSVPPVGFALYFPAGPGGYFDFRHNFIYQVTLRLGFRLNGRVLYNEADFENAGVQISSSYHSKNILAFHFSVSDSSVEAVFFQNGEDGLASLVTVHNSGSEELEAGLSAVQTVQFGPPDWWGRDGIAGACEKESNLVVLRSFAAGPVFALSADIRALRLWVAPGNPNVRELIEGRAEAAQSATSYYPDPLLGGLICSLKVPAQAAKQCGFYLARGVDLRKAVAETARGQTEARAVLSEKRAEDDRFWSHAPRLEGDFPSHWKNAWVYDFETLRTMVRRPIGVYRHPWDAMQIQAPRNVLAETSIDMWTLSYADSEAAKAVLLGQFEDAIEPNVPCMREDGAMNMVATDGSECGTALQWCYPFFCIHSVYLRTLDRQWVHRLYPSLTAYLEWTLKNRRDRDGFIVAKCSWETGMDASKRFLINQPTGGEQIDFVRIAELQAAMSQAAQIMQEYAVILGQNEDAARWQSLAALYARKSQALWFGDWFYDLDARTGKPIMIPAHREITQAGPVMCGVATPDQVRTMIPKMREYEANQKYWLEWPSQVLPYVESMWFAGEREFLSRVLDKIVERVYSSMDRRAAEPEKKLGWPGVSCEMWGLTGARGGECYGWGATLPAHIIRSFFGFREAESSRKRTFLLGPNIPDRLAGAAKTFVLRNLQYRGQTFDFCLQFETASRLTVTIGPVPWSTSHPITVTDGNRKPVAVTNTSGGASFRATNHFPYLVEWS
jgi:hypothetical protein